MERLHQKGWLFLAHSRYHILQKREHKFADRHLVSHILACQAPEAGDIFMTTIVIAIF